MRATPEGIRFPLPCPFPPRTACLDPVRGHHAVMHPAFPGFISFVLLGVLGSAQETIRPALPPIPAPIAIPQPGPTNDAPYAPQPILPGGIIVPLYSPDSPQLNAARVREAEQYNLSKSAPGRINSIVNIHNPSIEVHTVDGGINTGAVVILAAGGGHNSLNVGSESADFVPFFYQFGVNTVILRNRLRRDGYNVKTNAVEDAMQAIRLVRAHARDWNLDPNKIGFMGFSAGAELAAPPALFFEEFDRSHHQPSDPFAGVSCRPDFVALIYPGPTPFSQGENPPVPRNTPPAFLACAGPGDRIHALWADEYYRALLDAGIPNIEMHLYGRGRHPGDPFSDGSRMTAGLGDRNGMPMGKWQDRFIEWFRDLGFLQKPGVETRAAQDIAAFLKEPSPTPFKSPSAR